jgi:hypothetical protein
MSFKKLHELVQSQKGVISTKWLKEEAISLSSINGIKEQWSGVLDDASLRGFYIEGPQGPPVPLEENEALIVLSRSMCKGPLGAHWRRFVYTKELMHVFDTLEEKTDDAAKLDLLIRRFSDPSKGMPPQFWAENKAYWRALMCLCPDDRRKEYLAQINANAISLEVVASALRIPPTAVSDLFRADFPDPASLF